MLSYSSALKISTTLSRLSLSTLTKELKEMEKVRVRLCICFMNHGSAFSLSFRTAPNKASCADGNVLSALPTCGY